MTEKAPKTLIKSFRTPHTDQQRKCNGSFSYSAKEPGLSIYFYTFLYARLDGVALELLSLLCASENSTKYGEVSFDSDSLSE